MAIINCSLTVDIAEKHSLYNIGWYYKTVKNAVLCMNEQINTFTHEQLFDLCVWELLVPICRVCCFMLQLNKSPKLLK